MNVSDYYTAWHERSHAELFDRHSRLSLSELRKTYESFNEIRLFMQNEEQIQGPAFVEVGCATGELYRYLKSFYPRFRYSGFDISEASINLAKQKYPEADWNICDETLLGISEYIDSPSILFARDVIHHQTTPFDFMAKLISKPREAAILRIRTRDKGETVLDPERSCQWIYGKWVPFIVMNVDEVIETIKRTRTFRSLSILKHYQQLGGWNSRYLPKECYYPDTGTAQTAIYVQFLDECVSDAQITIEERVEPKVHYNLLERGRRWVRSRMSDRA